MSSPDQPDPLVQFLVAVERAQAEARADPPVKKKIALSRVIGMLVTDTAVIDQLFNALVERDNLRKFLSFESDPGPHAHAWCCYCQASHPIDEPHVSSAEAKTRIDTRTALLAEIRGLRTEIETLARGEFSDKTLSILLERQAYLNDQCLKWREFNKELAKKYKALKGLADAVVSAYARNINEPDYDKLVDERVEDLDEFLSPSALEGVSNQ